MNTPDFMPVLGHGKHSDPKDGACVMEMVSFLAGEKFSDEPNCVHTTIRSLAITVNDWVSDDNRSRIALMIPMFMGTSELDILSMSLIHNRVVQDVSPKYKEWDRHPKGISSAIFETGDIISEGPILWIKRCAAADEGDQRKTNEEYDDAMISYLTDVMEIVESFMDRDTPAIEPLLEQAATHVSQKVNA